MSAENVNFSGTINAPDAYFEGIHVVKGSITEGEISKAKINSCTIVSQIASKNYNPGTGTWKTKKGFLFDAGGEEFAIYGRSPECTTEDPDVVISSTEIKLPAATITGKLTAAEISGTNITANTITAAQIQAKAIGANEIAANAITAEKIAAGAITSEKLQTGLIEGVVDGKLSKLTINADSIEFTSSDNFIARLNKQDGLIAKGVKSTEFAKPTYDSDGNLETNGKGFYLTSKDESTDYKGDGKSHFALYGSKTFEETDSTGAKTTITKPFIISDDDIQIPAAYIENLTVGNIENFKREVNSAIWEEIGNNAASLKNTIQTVLADSADVYVKNLFATNDGNVVSIGPSVETTSGNSIAYTSAKKDGGNYYSTGTATYHLLSDNAIQVNSGDTLIIPTIIGEVGAKNITGKRTST